MATAKEISVDVLPKVGDILTLKCGQRRALMDFFGRQCCFAVVLQCCLDEKLWHIAASHRAVAPCANWKPQAG